MGLRSGGFYHSLAPRWVLVEGSHAMYVETVLAVAAPSTANRRRGEGEGEGEGVGVGVDEGEGEGDR